ncbi:hypothetical protein [Euzebya sp.]|uniref:hypothetical protein n=1 Tax=Euzebya sp. TaxID=1971409 RepID=UPI00351503B8
MDGDPTDRDRDDAAPGDHPPKADRPGGPGQTGMNPVGSGQETPAPAGDAPQEDETTRERRSHLREKGGE